MPPEIMFGGEPKKFSELLEMVMADIIVCPEVKNDLRYLKCFLIEDLFRVKKQLANVNPAHLSDITTNCVKTFDEYYDLDLDSLELKLATLSAKLSRYMRSEVERHNRANWNPKDDDESGWKHLDIR